MRYHVLMQYTPSWKELAGITVPVMEQYCSKHGYIPSANECTSYQHYNGKEKLKHILNDLQDNDTALVMDADSMITNLNKRIEDFIDDEHDLFISKHVGNINAGVFIIRLTKWSRKFIEFLLENIGKEKIYCEQDAMNLFMQQNPHTNKIKILPHPSINSLVYSLYPEHDNITKQEQGVWNKGDFIVHLPGVGMDKRIETLTNLKEQIVYA